MEGPGKIHRRQESADFIDRDHVLYLEVVIEDQTSGNT